MKFATIGHLLDKQTLNLIPKDWMTQKRIISPEKDINGIKGHITGIPLTAYEMMNLPLEQVRETILEMALFLQDEFHVDLIQLGALTTSVTSGGVWLTNQTEYTGYVNHGDSYTAAVTCQTVEKILQDLHKHPSSLTLSIIGAYGIIGEAVSKILAPQFKQTILIGPNNKKLNDLSLHIQGNYQLETELQTNASDIIVTATSHPKALLQSYHLKKHAVIVDVSQPPNLTNDICKERPDIWRVDGGYVDFPSHYQMNIPWIPSGKLFSCIVEVIMQSLEKDHHNYVGSIDLNHLRKTEEWGKKYGFTVNTLTNFGQILTLA